jgi:spermidine synthase
LGVGTTAAYGVAGQEWTFYEIDPAVVKIARDKTLFYYLDQCSQARINYVLGDGRLRLREAQDKYYSLIALDAFSSDSIPLHLLTREAVELYLSKLADHGIIAFHISNRHFNLAPALASVAKSYSLSAFVMEDTTLTFEEARNGKEPSVWVVMARSSEDLNPVTANGRWKSLSAPDNFRPWTDDFSNILSVLKR